MPSIDTLPNGKYRARWRTPSSESRSQTFRQKVDAQRHLTEVENSKLEGDYIDMRTGKMTFRTYAEQGAGHSIAPPNTARQIECHFRRHVYPLIGDRPIGAFVRVRS
jgi:hypothetical protein